LRERTISTAQKSRIPQKYHSSNPNDDGERTTVCDAARTIEKAENLLVRERAEQKQREIAANRTPVLQ